jgi:putative nucleotidyltransferase with HDIG domain
MIIIMSATRDGDFASFEEASNLEIPSLPIVAVKALQILGEELSNADELAEVISFDPAFTSHVFKMANSPYFCRGASVSSLDEAVLRLGFETVSEIVAVSALKDLRRKADVVDVGLWEHSTAVAVTSKLIANQIGIGSPKKHLIHGLLHDFGKMVMNINFKDKYAMVIDEVRSSGQSFEDVEFSNFGFTHCGIGDYVAKNWHLPIEIRSVISLHHRTAAEIAKHKDISDILIVKAADHICSELRIGIYDNIGPIEKDLQFIGLTNSSRVQSLKDKVEEEYQRYKSSIFG